jgi:hypothetical protein
MKVGRGILKFSDGTRYEGPFVDGKRHGYGLLKDKKGKQTWGEWYHTEHQHITRHDMSNERNTHQHKHNKHKQQRTKTDIDKQE